LKFLKKLHDWTDISEYTDQTDIFSSEDAAEFIYVILAGEVELTMDGDLLSTEETGGIIGEMAILESAQQGTTATAINDVKLARLNREQFNTFMTEHSEFSLHVMNTLARRLRVVHEYNTTNFEA
jgi:CRP-like cAMP-binding protein